MERVQSGSVLNLFFLPGTNFSSAFLALDSAPHADFLVHDKLPDDTNPATVVGQILVEFLGDFVDLPESGPRNSREVVVLIVQPNVVGQEIERSVVGEGLGDRDTLFGVARLLVLKRGTVKDVVLGDKVTSHRMQRSGQETAQDEVSNCFASP